MDAYLCVLTKLIKASAFVHLTAPPSSHLPSWRPDVTGQSLAFFCDYSAGWQIQSSQNMIQSSVLWAHENVWCLGGALNGPICRSMKRGEL